jgi:hypothetical protein
MLSLGLSLTSVSVRRRPASGGGAVQLFGSPGAAKVAVAYSFIPTPIGGNGTKSYALTGTLPAGLAFSTTTGAISGTPTTVGTASGLNITVTDSSGSASLGVFSLTVAAEFVDFSSPVSLLWAA